ncbi:MAG: hypothetical protein WAU24_04820 [Chitinophagaceae bacterium]
MKKILTICIFTISIGSAFSQHVDFTLNRPKIFSIDSIEKSKKGELFETSISITVSKDYFPNADKFNLANPLIYFRNGEIFNLETNYYYSLPDSIIRLVSYSWDGSPKMVNYLNTLFESNSNIFTQYFGLKGEEKNEHHDTWDLKSLTWQNDSVYVNQFFVTSQSTNRVRVLISWK